MVAPGGVDANFQSRLLHRSLFRPPQAPSDRCALPDALIPSDQLFVISNSRALGTAAATADAGIQNTSIPGRDHRSPLQLQSRLRARLRPLASSGAFTGHRSFAKLAKSP
jgi:hypothetical protein